VAPAADDLSGEQLDGRVGRQLVASCRVEVGRRARVLAEQAADPVRGEVALAAGVDDERPPACAAEHQRGAQAGGAGTDDDAIPGRRPFAVSVDVLLTEQCDTHQLIFSASSTMIPAGPRT
jgi:hypothetical protein